MADKNLFTVGELAKEMGVTVRTLQYYDRENILKPSSFSEGGRRLYSKKDMVKLHQIMSLKYLGFSLEEIRSKVFSLDKPAEVIAILENQGEILKQQAEMLLKAADSVKLLCEEVKQIDEVDFDKYAGIISLLRLGNEHYWIWKYFDDELAEHVKERFGNNPEDGKKVMDTYQSLLDRALDMKNQGKSPTSTEAKELAGEWWSMIMDFTGGDMTLIPKLMEFNDKKNKWNNMLADKQSLVDNFMEEALSSYFEGLEVAAKP